MSFKNTVSHFKKYCYDKSSSILMILMCIFLTIYLILTLIKPDLIGPATIGILGLTFLAATGQMDINKQHHKQIIHTTYRTKQLEDLYMPLQSVSPNFWKLDVKEIEKYSYLAMGKLEKHIEALVTFLKAPNELTFPERTELYTEIADAIEEDIAELKKDLKDI